MWPCRRRHYGDRLNGVEGCPSPITGKSVSRQRVCARTTFSNRARCVSQQACRLGVDSRCYKKPHELVGW